MTTVTAAASNSASNSASKTTIHIYEIGNAIFAVKQRRTGKEHGAADSQIAAIITTHQLNRISLGSIGGGEDCANGKWGRLGKGVKGGKREAINVATICQRCCRRAACCPRGAHQNVLGYFANQSDRRAE